MKDLFTPEEWQIIFDAMDLFLDDCQMGRRVQNYHYWKDIAPVQEALHQIRETGQRWDTGLRARLGG